MKQIFLGLCLLFVAVSIRAEEAIDMQEVRLFEQLVLDDFKKNCYSTNYLSQRGLNVDIESVSFDFDKGTVTSSYQDEILQSYNQDIIYIYSDRIKLEEKIDNTLRALTELQEKYDDEKLLSIISDFPQGSNLNNKLDWVFKVSLGAMLLYNYEYYTAGGIYHEALSNVDKISCPSYDLEYYEMLEYGKALKGIPSEEQTSIFSTMFWSDDDIVVLRDRIAIVLEE